MEPSKKKNYIFFTLYTYVKKSKTQMWGKTLYIEFVYNFQIKYSQVFKWETGAYISVHNILLASIMT